MKRGLAPSSVCSAPRFREGRLADNPARAVPTVDRAIPEVAEHARRSPRAGTETLRLGKLIDQCCLQAAIARQAKHVVDAVCLTPSHQLVVGEAAVGAENDARARPFLADPSDNARDLFDRAITARDVGTPLAGQQQVPPAEHVERQVAVLFIIAVEEPAFLLAVQRNVGVVEIQHDLARCAFMRFEEKIHQQPIDLRIVAIDLVILRRMSPRRVLQAIERALASQRLAVGPQHRVQLARQHRKRRILAQLVVIVEVFIAQRQAEDALSHQGLDLMLDIARVAPIDEAVGEATHQPEASVDLSQQQCTCVRGDVAAPGLRRGRLSKTGYD
jgi:hypothetical protein